MALNNLNVTVWCHCTLYRVNKHYANFVYLSIT